MPQRKVIKKEFDFERLVVDVTTAKHLTETEIKKISLLLSKALNVKEVFINEKVIPSLLGGFQLQVGSCLIDVSFLKKLRKLESLLSSMPLSKISSDGLEKVLQDIKQKKFLDPKVENIGRVISVKDGIVRVKGMKNVRAGELINFPNECKGIVFNINTKFCDIVSLSPVGDLDEGDIATQTGTVVKVPIGKELMGRVVNALGEPIDNKGGFGDDILRMPLEAAVPGIIDRQPVSKPFQTGVKVIDALVPIGLGQRELIVGDRQTGKTSLIIDSILSQKKINDAAQNEKEKVYCIYVSVGQKQSTVAQVVRVLQEAGALDYTCVVCAFASDSASLQYIAPFTGTTIGEFFRDRGMNAVVFYDDLSKHANAYRQISLLLRRPPGREAYPGDIFYLHSRLLERAAMMSDKKGGGSLTAIPVVETQEGDVSSYIPTNVISITDGQIFLESSLFHQGIRPAVNVGLSVSRVGSKAQRPLIAKISGSMKLELAQYREMLSFAQIASDLDTTTQDLLHKGKRLTEVLKQPLHRPLSFADEFLSLYAVVNGFYVSMQPEDILSFEVKMLETIHSNYPDLIKAIQTAQKELPKEIILQLNDVLREAVALFVSQKKSQEK